MFMCIKWLIFSGDLLSLYPAVHLLKMWLSGIMAITNSNSDSASPWNMPLWIFTSANLCRPVVVSALHVCMVFSINCTTFLVFYTFWDSVVSSFGGLLFLILSSITPLEFFTSVLADGFSLEFEWQQVSSSLQDSFQYSGRPQQCCHLDSIYPSANFQVLQAF